LPLVLGAKLSTTKNAFATYSTELMAFEASTQSFYLFPLLLNSALVQMTPYYPLLMLNFKDTDPTGASCVFGSSCATTANRFLFQTTTWTLDVKTVS